MNLLITGCFKYTDEQIKILKDKANVYFWQDEREVINFDVSQIDAAIVNGLFLYNDVTKFTNLKSVQVTSAGLDRVPVDYFKEHNISLYNARGVYSIPMAEYTLAKILEVYKKNNFFYENQKNRLWEKNRDLIELCNKTATIVGTGSVGLEVAKRLKAFDVNVLGVDLFPKESVFLDEIFHLNDIKVALEKSDIVVLTVPLTDKTKHMFNYELLKMIKKDSLLINISRGAIINTEDLLICIKENHFLGVVLDVFEEEPLPKESELWDNVIITPHNSFVSKENNERMFNLMLKNLFDN